MIVTLYPLPGRIDFGPGQIIAKFGGNFDMPVVYYRQFVSVGHRRNAGNAAPKGRFNKVRNLEEIAAK